MGLKIKTRIATMIRWVTKKNTCHRTSTKFVQSGGGLDGETQVTEDTKKIVRERCAKQELVWHQGAGGLTWSSITI